MILDAVRQELDTSKDERGSRCVFRLDVETNFSPRGAGGGSIKRRIAETKVCIASSWPPTRRLEFGQLSGQFLVSGEQFPQFHESPYHVYTYVNCAGRIENARCHYRTMLGKRIGQRARNFSRVRWSQFVTTLLLRPPSVQGENRQETAQRCGGPLG